MSLEDLEKFRWWIGQHPYLAGTLAFWVVCTLFGRWQPSKDFVARYPRVLPAVLIGRDVGLAISRLGKPIVAFFSPKALHELLVAFYGPDEAPVVDSARPQAPTTGGES